MESPVWIPTGSTFSIEQIAIALPAASRMVSNSISFQPEIHFSTSICVMGDMSRPVFAITLSSSSLSAIPPPVPPRVNAGRTITGYPISAAILSAVSTSLQVSEGTTGWPISFIVSRKSSLSSALSIPAIPVPRSLTPYFCRVPSRVSCMAMVRPVCPPSPARRPSGLSFAIILRTVFALRGSR